MEAPITMEHGQDSSKTSNEEHHQTMNEKSLFEITDLSSSYSGGDDQYSKKREIYWINEQREEKKEPTKDQSPSIKVESPNDFTYRFPEIKEDPNSEHEIKLQFGQGELNEEVVEVCCMLERAITNRLKYQPHKFPWKKTEKEISAEASPPPDYDGRIAIKGTSTPDDELRLEKGVYTVKMSINSEKKEEKSTPQNPTSNKSLLKKKSKEDEDEEKELKKEIIKTTVEFKEYLEDLTDINIITKSAACKSYCFSRIYFLTTKFDMYKEMFGRHEVRAQKEVPHRDFYNVRKIDNHIHLSSAMNQKFLLRFIKKKFKENGDDVVITDKKTKEKKTLKEVFKSMNLEPYDLSVDRLDVHATKDEFHRFDRFNQKFDPFGTANLRSIFLKTDNDIKGRYFGELIGELYREYEKAKYQLAEVRVSLYGRSRDELFKLAHWVHDNKLYSENIRYLIQIPRLFSIYLKGGQVKNFQGFLENIFYSFFYYSREPQKDPIVSNFLENYLVGFDCVDDETVFETELSKDMEIDSPLLWGQTRKDNPPYSYYNYYIWANIQVLNQYRKKKGMSTFAYRPHAGEAGDLIHLSSSFLLASSINHGIRLKESPVLTYLYYLMQIGVSVAPLSNNCLFLNYEKNPFPNFFKIGMNVSLSTDDPLIIHYTKEPLIEEYSIAQQIYHLTNADICEVARNSVLQSGWSREHKQYWISRYYDENGVHSNNIKKTCVPEIRIQYRHETLLEEILFLNLCCNLTDKIKKKSPSPNVDSLNSQDSIKPRLTIEEIKAAAASLRKHKFDLFAHPNQFSLNLNYNLSNSNPPLTPSLSPTQFYSNLTNNNKNNKTNEKENSDLYLKLPFVDFTNQAFVNDVNQAFPVVNMETLKGTVKDLQNTKSQLLDIKSQIHNLKLEQKRLKMRKKVLQYHFDQMRLKTDSGINLNNKESKELFVLDSQRILDDIFRFVKKEDVTISKKEEKK